MDRIQRSYHADGVTITVTNGIITAVTADPVTEPDPEPEPEEPTPSDGEEGENAE